MIDPYVNTMDDVRRALQWLKPTPMSTYDVTWTGAGGNPALGNGTLTGYCAMFSQFCFVQIVLTAGSTTTFGTGQWSFSLPKACVSGGTTFGTGTMGDASAPLDYSLIASLSSGAQTVAPLWSNGSGNAVAVTSASPFAWATSDTLKLSILYVYR